MILPKTSLVRHNDTHRLIPSKYSQDEDDVLASIAPGNMLADISALAAITDDRILAEHERLEGIDTHELVFGVPYARIVNAAFTHAHPLGSRFNGPKRGTWYAAFDIETSHAEVAFHKSVHLAEIGCFEDEVIFDDYLADFSAFFHDIREDERFVDCLAPDSYVRSQTLAEHLLDNESLGVIYPSVRHGGGTCVACFRPALVTNVRKDAAYRVIWSGSEVPTISAV